MAARVRAWISLGANLGDARAAVLGASAELTALPASRLIAQSSLYRSAPVDATGPDFVNAVAGIDTALSATDLLAALQTIEQRHGRVRGERNAPRTLDLDLLLHGEAVIDTPALTLPHPRLHERAFVLLPLAEVAPDLVVPGRGAVRELLRGLGAQAIERLMP